MRVVCVDPTGMFGRKIIIDGRAVMARHLQGIAAHEEQMPPDATWFGCLFLSYPELSEYQHDNEGGKKEKFWFIKSNLTAVLMMYSTVYAPRLKLQSFFFFFSAPRNS